LVFQFYGEASFLDWINFTIALTTYIYFNSVKSQEN